LDLLVVQKLGLGEAKDFEGLRSGDEAAFDAEPLFSDLFAADVQVFFREMLIVFLDQILPHLLSADLLFLVDWLYLSHQGLLVTEEGALDLGVLFLVDALGASRCSRSVV